MAVPSITGAVNCGGFAGSSVRYRPSVRSQQMLGRAWAVVGHLSTAQFVLYVLVLVVVVVLGAFGIRLSTTEAMVTLSLLLTAVGVAALAFMAWVLAATRLGLVPEGYDAVPKWKKPSAEQVAEFQRVLNRVLTEPEFSNSPHLMWSGLDVFPFGSSYEVTVSCNNVGGTAQLIRPGTWVRSTVDLLGSPILGTNPVQTTVTKTPERIDFFSFDCGGHISPGPFTLHIRCDDSDPDPGEREVRWRLMYMDDDMKDGFITECSVRIAFVGIGSPRVLGEPAYDTTSRKQRNDDYLSYMKDKQAASTGPRRPH